MRSLARALILAVLASTDPSAAFAVDCAQIRKTDPSIVFCEDFEAPELDGGTGWADRYGPPVDGCWASPFRRNMEGTCPTCCVNVVSASSCEVPGQTGCVFQGNQALGHRFRPGETQGIVGRKRIATGANFGVTMAVKFSRNFVNADAPKKTDQFGPSGNCVLGCSSGTIVSQTAGNPYHGSFFMRSQSAGASALRGLIHSNATGFRWAAKVPADYDFDRDFGLDRWHCRQFHTAGVGKAGARIRDWIDSRLLVDVVNVDLSKMRDASAGLSSIVWNNHVNGGYPGTSIAYRYEDNVVVTTGPEPVSCAAIGFARPEP